jgi:hypothetical protein
MRTMRNPVKSPTNALGVPGAEQAKTYGKFRQLEPATIAEAKAKQSIKIREFEVALRRAGLIALDEQAKALGLPRTTTWKLLKGSYKTSGPSAVIINRILCAPRLPLTARIKILEYIQERVSGVYGHSKSQLRRFSIRIGWGRTPIDEDRTADSRIAG